ncbi:MAG: transporter [Nitrospirae bacterium]|nr:transporter [Nitrospirota bacterium]
MVKRILLPIFMMLITAGQSFASHPLITDDTGTQTTGKAQLEFVIEYGHDREDGASMNSLMAPTVPVLSYGITDTADLVLGISYLRRETMQDGMTTTESGISDASIQLKWRFHEKDGWSFALRPGITLPSGDENKGLGNGKASYTAFFIITRDIAPWVFHVNIGFLRNEYKLRLDEEANRKDRWHVSLASQVDIITGLTAVANIGMERNPDKRSNSDPAFLLGGVVYSITESLDLDAGIKAGLNKPETDITYLAGVAKRF